MPPASTSATAPAEATRGARSSALVPAAFAAGAWASRRITSPARSAPRPPPPAISRTPPPIAPRGRPGLPPAIDELERRRQEAAPRPDERRRGCCSGRRTGRTPRRRRRRRRRTATTRRCSVPPRTPSSMPPTRRRRRRAPRDCEARERATGADTRRTWATAGAARARAGRAATRAFAWTSSTRCRPARSSRGRSRARWRCASARHESPAFFPSRSALAATLSCRGFFRAATGLFTQQDEPLAGSRPLLNLWRGFVPPAVSRGMGPSPASPKTPDDIFTRISRLSLLFSRRDRTRRVDDPLVTRRHHLHHLTFTSPRPRGPDSHPSQENKTWSATYKAMVYQASEGRQGFRGGTLQAREGPRERARGPGGEAHRLARRRRVQSRVGYRRPGWRDRLFGAAHRRSGGGVGARGLDAERDAAAAAREAKETSDKLLADQAEALKRAAAECLIAERVDRHGQLDEVRARLNGLKQALDVNSAALEASHASNRLALATFGLDDAASRGAPFAREARLVRVATAPKGRARGRGARLRGARERGAGEVGVPDASALTDRRRRRARGEGSLREVPAEAVGGVSDVLRRTPRR